MMNQEYRNYFYLLFFSLMIIIFGCATTEQDILDEMWMDPDNSELIINAAEYYYENEKYKKAYAQYKKLETKKGLNEDLEYMMYVCGIRQTNLMKESYERIFSLRNTDAVQYSRMSYKQNANFILPDHWILLTYENIRKYSMGDMPEVISAFSRSPKGAGTIKYDFQKAQNAKIEKLKKKLEAQRKTKKKKEGKKEKEGRKEPKLEKWASKIKQMEKELEAMKKGELKIQGKSRISSGSRSTSKKIRYYFSIYGGPELMINCDSSYEKRSFGGAYHDYSGSSRNISVGGSMISVGGNLYNAPSKIPRLSPLIKGKLLSKSQVMVEDPEFYVYADFSKGKKGQKYIKEKYKYDQAISFEDNIVKYLAWVDVKTISAIYGMGYVLWKEKKRSQKKGSMVDFLMFKANISEGKIINITTRFDEKRKKVYVDELTGFLSSLNVLNTTYTVK